MNRTETELTSLPDPGEAAREHSRMLADSIRTEIGTAGGRIPFRRFMELALYAPGLGYYSAGSSKLGAEGDFVTAPELSPLFSRCLARLCEPLIRDMDACVILEPGAGSGRMAADMLLELERRGALPAAYWILETSAELRARQEHTLHERVPQMRNRIRWLNSLPAEPFEGLIIANEVLDAIPFHRIQLSGGEILELHVACGDGGFQWQSLPADRSLADYARRVLEADRRDYPDGYTTEVNPALQPFIASLSDLLKRGLMLFIDYGYPRSEYYHAQRSDGTLLCHYRHRVHDDPFRFVGLQDITASVDFTAVAEAAAAAGLDVLGFTPQAQLLLGSGLDTFIGECADDPDRLLETSRQAKLLTLPGEMGERFKAMALGRDLQQDLPAFKMADHRNRL